MFCRKCGAPCRSVTLDGRERSVCAGCGRVHYDNPFPCVSVIVSDGGRIALGKRGDQVICSGKWCLPCGYIELGESHADAAVREVKEEIGVDVLPLRVVNVVSNRLFSQISSLVVVFLAQPLSTALVPGDDIVEAGWFDPRGELPPLAFDADRYIIGKFAQSINAGREMPGIDMTDTQGWFVQE